MRSFSNGKHALTCLCQMSLGQALDLLQLLAEEGELVADIIHPPVCVMCMSDKTAGMRSPHASCYADLTMQALSVCELPACSTGVAFRPASWQLRLLVWCVKQKVQR